MTPENIKSSLGVFNSPSFTLISDRYSVANSGRLSVIADHLGVLVSQNKCRFLEMTEHN